MYGLRRSAVPSLYGPPNNLCATVEALSTSGIAQTAESVATCIPSASTHQSTIPSTPPGIPSTFTPVLSSPCMPSGSTPFAPQLGIPTASIAVPSTSEVPVTSTPILKYRKRLPFSFPSTEQSLAEPSSLSWIRFEHSYASQDKFDKCIPDGIHSSELSSQSNSLSLQDISMTRLSHLNTPRKRYLYKYGKKRDNELKRLRKKYRKIRVQLDKICNRKNVIATAVDSFSKHMSAASAILLSSQVRCFSQMPKGRRWSVEEKALALSLYKRSSKAYTLLCHAFALPSKRTLKRLVNKLPFTSGINDQMFTTLRQHVDQLNERDKVCSLIFDEMSIREHLQYNRSTDRIDGYEDIGHKGRTRRIANHALVFMVRGLFRKWKQPVAYYFSHSSVRSEILVELIVNIIDACTGAGLYVAATVCDMGAANVKALKIMGSAKPDHPYFLYKDRPIFTILDPPHLIKCTRNLLQKYNIKCHVKTGSLEFDGEAKWDHIKQTFQWDRDTAVFRQLHHLTNDHLQPLGGHKMKVYLAAQVLSHRVAACINTAVMCSK